MTEKDQEQTAAFWEFYKELEELFIARIGERLTTEGALAAILLFGYDITRSMSIGYSFIPETSDALRKLAARIREKDWHKDN